VSGFANIFLTDRIDVEKKLVQTRPFKKKGLKNLFELSFEDTKAAMKNVMHSIKLRIF